ncbi:hypothetical protein PoB_007102000 [Plakobranchus ocellatus]|uniref:Uncharacterized protein n=1 Tax=Plakobranchus ocellatus TaxID=259542 RepID=A0AAV4DK42_9GAST|nr:hypothetical protein PoB_007102000 [Plakobranchus ocellatus]
MLRGQTSFIKYFPTWEKTSANEVKSSLPFPAVPVPFEVAAPAIKGHNRTQVQAAVARTEPGQFKRLPAVTIDILRFIVSRKKSCL